MCGIRAPPAGDASISHPEMASTRVSECMFSQGWRTSMEDAHCAELDLDGKKSCFFGVYDGVFQFLSLT